MRLKNLLLISIMLIILTIGAVSAADNNSTSDALTLDEQTDEISVVDVEKIASDSSEVIGENGTFYPGGGNGTYHVNDTSRVAPNMSVNAPDISYGQTASVNTYLPGDATGSVEITFAAEHFPQLLSTDYLLCRQTVWNREIILSMQSTGEMETI